MAAFDLIRAHVSHGEKVTGENKAKMISCSAMDEGRKKLIYLVAGMFIGSAMGRAGSPAVARTGERVSGCD
jgi:hypothetical protein